VSKLSDIIDAATTDTTFPVASVLRMVKVVAARMDTPPLADWVDNELGGYAAGVAVPDYRGPFHTEVLSEWNGPYSSISRNVPLAPSAVPEVFRELGAFEVTFRKSISELERLAKLDSLAYRWPSDAVALLNGHIARGEVAEIVRDHVLVSAAKISSPDRAAAAVDSVRTRVLDLALQLEKVAPDAGELGAAPADPAIVNNIVNTYVYGHGNAVAVDSPGAVQLGGVNAGDLDGLLKAVADLGLQPEGVAELEEAIRGDEADEEAPAGRPGSRVASFLGQLSLGAFKIAGKEGIHEGVNVIGDLVKAHYGFS
jgi:hypothetical protein